MIAVLILASIIVLGLKSWVVMLLLGALHSHVEAVPALGFVPSLWLTLLVSVLFAGLNPPAPRG